MCKMGVPGVGGESFAPGERDVHYNLYSQAIKKANAYEIMTNNT